MRDNGDSFIFDIYIILLVTELNMPPFWSIPWNTLYNLYQI